MGEIRQIGDIVREKFQEGFSEADTENLKNDEFRGPDGLIYCARCGAKKQRYIDIPPGLLDQEGGRRIVPVLCKCGLEERERKEREDKHNQLMIQIGRLRDASLMDTKYRDARFSEYQLREENKKAYQFARKYVEHFPDMLKENQGIILWGPVGTGKSFTAACIANELLDRQTSVIMTSFVKILQNIQGQDESSYIAALNRASLLILDDLGTERNTDYALEKVYNIVDSRSRESKPMILTTNLELPDMLNVQDIRYRRIYDRIFETCLPVEISGESFRKVSAAQRFDKMAKFMEE